MDWAHTELQTMVRDLTREVLAGVDLAPDASGTAPAAWVALGQAGVLAAPLSEAQGGLDGGVLEACTLAIEIGRAAAPLPVLPSLFGGTLPLAACGDHPLLAALGSGEARVAAAWTPESAVTLRGDRLSGAWVAIAGLGGATALVVPTREALVLVDAAHLAPTAQTACNGGPLHNLTLVDAPCERLGDAAASAHARDLAQLGLAAVSLGLASGALALTSTHARERQQFGRPIGTFQAVQQRAGDMYIQVQAMEVTLWQAAWRISEGLDASRELAIARTVASLGTHQVCSAAHHLHGGMGFDRDYPLTRYTQWARQLETVLGGPEAQLARIGQQLACRQA